MCKRFFYDCEFIEDGTAIDLVSVGIVAEDGTEFYAVNGDFDQSKLTANKWLCQNVWPHLPKREHPSGARCRCIHGHLDADHPDVRPRAQLARAVKHFLLEDGVPIELWAYYAAYDHVALAQLFGSMTDLPEGLPMFTHDIKQLQSSLAGKALPEHTGRQHHALDDARHVKAMWEDLVLPF